jgi:tetratricopeptide (TPR) repeat protein
MCPSTLRRSGLLGARRLFLLALTLLLLPLAAQAGSKESKESKERAAKTACLSGDYAKGVTLLAELYVSFNDVAYLFNQGRCYEQSGKYAEAIVSFREYALKNEDAGNGPDAAVEKHIAHCQALIDNQKLAAHVGMSAPAAASSVQPGAAATLEPQSPVAAPVPADVKPQEPRVGIVEAASVAPGRSLRVAGITVAVVGAAGIASGVLLNIKANRLASNLEAANGSSTTMYSRSTESSRSTYQTFGWVAYGAGAASVAGGAILYFLGYSRGQNGQVAFVPTAGAGHLGAALQGAF